MQLQTVRPNIVQSIRAYTVAELMEAAEQAGQHFLYANVANAQSKQEVLEGIAEGNDITFADTVVLAGNALASDASWTFTTAAPPPPTG